MDGTGRQASRRGGEVAGRQQGGRVRPAMATWRGSTDGTPMARAMRRSSTRQRTRSASRGRARRRGWGRGAAPLCVRRGRQEREGESEMGIRTNKGEGDQDEQRRCRRWRKGSREKEGVDRPRVKKLVRAAGPWAKRTGVAGSLLSL